MDERQTPEHELIRQYLDGDAAAFDCLYERYRRPLYAFLNRLVPGQTARADDLFQKTWLRMLDAFPRYREQERFAAWMFRIAHNLAMDEFRTGAGIAESANPAELAELPVAGAEAPWTDLARAELAELVDRAVADLAPEQREVFLLRQQDLSFNDIAQVQNTGINTVLGRMHYAISHLRQRLDQSYREITRP